MSLPLKPLLSRPPKGTEPLFRIVVFGLVPNVDTEGRTLNHISSAARSLMMFKPSLPTAPEGMAAPNIPDMAPVESRANPNCW